MKQSIRKLILPFANVYILLSLLYYWFETYLLNPIAIGLVVAFLCHFYLAKASGKFIFPLGFIMINLYMFLALFSEFREFNSLTNDAILLLVVGIVYLGLNIFSALWIMLESIRTYSDSSKIVKNGST